MTNKTYSETDTSDAATLARLTTRLDLEERQCLDHLAQLRFLGGIVSWAMLASVVCLSLHWNTALVLPLVVGALAALIFVTDRLALGKALKG